MVYIIGKLLGKAFASALSRAWTRSLVARARNCAIVINHRLPGTAFMSIKHWRDVSASNIRSISRVNVHARARAKRIGVYTSIDIEALSDPTRVIDLGAARDIIVTSRCYAFPKWTRFSFGNSLVGATLPESPLLFASLLAISTPPFLPPGIAAMSFRCGSR